MMNIYKQTIKWNDRDNSIFLATELLVLFQKILVRRALLHFFQFLVGNPNVFSQAVNRLECFSTNLTNALLFINELFELFFEMLESLMTLEMIFRSELFLTEIAGEVRSTLVDRLPHLNMKRLREKLF